MKFALTRKKTKDVYYVYITTSYRDVVTGTPTKVYWQKFGPEQQLLEADPQALEKIQSQVDELNARKIIAGKHIVAFHAGLDSTSEHSSAGWTPDAATDDAMARTTIHFATVHGASWLLVRASDAMLRLLPEADIIFSSKDWIVAKAPMLQQDLTPLPPAPPSQDGKALAPQNPKK